MSWHNTIPVMVRYLINDVDPSSYKYSDPRIEKTVLVGAQFVSLELEFPNIYTIDFNNDSIIPDPTEENTRDNSFINLVALKTACIIIGSEFKTEAANAISIKDGPSAIDLRGVSSTLGILYKDLCDKYQAMADDYKFTGDTGQAILGPYSPGADFIARTHNDYDFRGNYFRY
jgi:hypothetical protein